MTALPMTGFHRARITPYGNNTLEIQLLWEVCRRVLRGSRAVRIRCPQIQRADFFLCPGLSPDSLVQLEQECVSVRQRRCCFASSASVRVAHLPQKPVIDSFFIFVFAFPAKRQKRLPFLRQSASITYILFLYMAVSTCLTSISRKVPPSKSPAAVTGISFLSAYLFAAVYASAPEKFLHPSDNSSPVSSF